MLKDELHSVPFLTTLDGKSDWKGDLYFFLIIQNIQSLQYIRKDVMVISVPYECPTWEIIVFISCTVWHHVYYDYLTVTSRLCPSCKIQRGEGGGDYVLVVKFSGGDYVLAVKFSGGDFVHVYKNEQGGVLSGGDFVLHSVL